MPKTPDKISIKMKFCAVTLEHVRNEQKKSPINRALGTFKVHNGGTLMLTLEPIVLKS